MGFVIVMRAHGMLRRWTATVAAFMATKPMGGTGLHPVREHRAEARAEDGEARLFCFAMQSATDGVPILLCQRDDVVGERLLIICPARHFALRRPVLAEYAAHAPLGHVQHLPDLVDAAPAPCGAQKFPFAFGL